MFNNETCFQTPNEWHYMGIKFFVAYCIIDGVNCAFIQRDFSKGMIQTYFHHTMGIIGCYLALRLQGYLAVGCSVSLLTEASTPFVNLRAILYDFKETNGSLYVNNCILMTLSFFLVRCVFQAWLVLFKIVPLYP